MISVLIVDDEQLVRQALQVLLKDIPEIKVIAQAETGQDAIAKVREWKPNIILLDLHLPDISGLHISQRITRQFPETKIIIITSQTNETFAERLLNTGVQGFFTKGIEQEELIQGIKDVSVGKRVIESQIAAQLAISRTTSQSNVLKTLSDREMEVLLMVLQGDEPQIIAKKLHLSPKTISTYRVNIFKKLGVKNNTELLLTISYFYNTEIPLKMGRHGFEPWTR